MNEHNAIDPKTGETAYVRPWEKLPKGWLWISDMDRGDWLKLVRLLGKGGDK